MIALYIFLFGLCALARICQRWTFKSDARRLGDGRGFFLTESADPWLENVPAYQHPALERTREGDVSFIAYHLGPLTDVWDKQAVRYVEIEDLSPVMRATTFNEKHLKLFKEQ
jgi:hypothetical protein